MIRIYAYRGRFRLSVDWPAHMIEGEGYLHLRVEHNDLAYQCAEALRRARGGK